MKELINKLHHWAKRPELIALVERGVEAMSFKMLDERSTCLAAYLLDKYPNNKPLAIWGDKENDAFTGIFASLKSGRPYTFIPKYYPVERANTILELSGAEVLLALADLPDGVKSENIIGYNDIDSIIAEYSGIEVSEDNYVSELMPACIIFTSGSTGVPKGVVIPAESIRTMVDWRFSIKTGLPENTNTPMVDPLSFTSSFTYIFYLMAKLGCTLWTIERTLLSDYPSLVARILKSNPHMVGGTPTLISIYLKDERFTSANLPNLINFLCGGELMINSIAANIRRVFPKATIWNIFGASETSAGGLMCEYTDEIISNNYILPTGFPISSGDVYLIDDNGEKVSNVDSGELVIVSELVASGYLNAPDKQAEVFFTAPDGRRGYRTHDLMRRENDLYFYTGRSDNLVKIGGNRIEVEEVERAVMLYPEVKQCVVVPAMKDGKPEMLVAYVVMNAFHESRLNLIISIKRFLSDKLPHYMVPPKYVFVDKLPLNVNNKVDRLKLRSEAEIK